MVIKVLSNICPPIAAVRNAPTSAVIAITDELRFLSAQLCKIMVYLCLLCILSYAFVRGFFAD